MMVSNVPALRAMSSARYHLPMIPQPFNLLDPTADFFYIAVLKKGGNQTYVEKDREKPVLCLWG